MRTNTGCTVYNRYIDPTTRKEKYQRVTLVAVMWQNRKAANTLRMGSVEADAATVFIPFTLGVNYLLSKAWQALTTKTGKWTLQPGDVIVKGLVSDEITEAVPGSAGPPIVPAVPAFTMSSLKAKYDDVLVITSVDTMDQGSVNMHHWQVGLK